MTYDDTSATAPSDAVHVAMMNLLWPRPGLPVQEFYDYWVGAHTQISSRLPGIHQYFQHQLDPEAGRLLPRLAGCNQEFSEDERFYGDAEITFVSPADLQDFAASLNPLMQDEQNVFSKTISYQAVGGNSRTLIDRTIDDSPNGDLGANQKFMLYLRKQHRLSLDEFRSIVLASAAPLLAEAPEVLKARVRLLDPYDNEAVTLLAPNVSNCEDPDRQYQGCIEIVFSDAIARQKFGCSGVWLSFAEILNDVSRTVHPMRALRTFTVYNHGRITTAGLRTPQIADQIRRMGAVNQVGDEVANLVLREHTQFSR